MSPPKYNYNSPKINPGLISHGAVAEGCCLGHRSGFALGDRRRATRRHHGNTPCRHTRWLFTLLTFGKSAANHPERKSDNGKQCSNWMEAFLRRPAGRWRTRRRATAGHRPWSCHLGTSHGHSGRHRLHARSRVPVHRHLHWRSAEIRSAMSCLSRTDYNKREGQQETDAYQSDNHTCTPSHKNLSKPVCLRILQNHIIILF